jgi:Ca2+-binding EF-hand superfamily protein
MKRPALLRQAPVYALALFAGLSHAQQPTPAQVQQALAQLESRFAAADTNQDGCVTKEEAKGKMPRLYNQFERVDKDKKGCVTMDALKASMQDLAAGRKAAN